jgi:hypothetical protein
MFEEEVNNPLRGKVDKLFAKKKSSSSGSAIVNFFVTKDPFQIDYMWPKTFLEDMGLLIIKNHLSMQFVESLQMKHLCLHLCQRLVFPFKK